MNNQKLTAAAVIAVIILIGGYMVINKQASPPGSTGSGTWSADSGQAGMQQIPDPDVTGTTGASGAMGAESSFTLTEVAAHNRATDCWLAIDGKVYDVTAFIASGNHGGKDAILEGCGKDATTLFNTRPMGSKTPHSDKARSFLPGFEIGTLNQG